MVKNGEARKKMKVNQKEISFLNNFLYNFFSSLWQKESKRGKK
jgi:hypothetical protein